MVSALTASVVYMRQDLITMPCGLHDFFFFFEFGGVMAASLVLRTVLLLPAGWAGLVPVFPFSHLSAKKSLNPSSL